MGAVFLTQMAQNCVVRLFCIISMLMYRYFSDIYGIFPM